MCRECLMLGTTARARCMSCQIDRVSTPENRVHWEEIDDNETKVPTVSPQNYDSIIALLDSKDSNQARWAHEQLQEMLAKEQPAPETKKAGEKEAPDNILIDPKRIQEIEDLYDEENVGFGFSEPEKKDWGLMANNVEEILQYIRGLHQRIERMENGMDRMAAVISQFSVELMSLSTRLLRD
jgi:hypothetical protein